MVKLFALFICLLVFSESHSQFNDTTFYYANLASTGLLNKTDERSSYLLNNVLKLNYKKKSFSINTINSWIYGKQQHVLTNNDYSSNIDFNLFATSRFYFWGLASYDKSYSLKINNRLQTGLGLGYNLIDKKYFILVLSDGILYEKSDLNQTSDQPLNKYQTFRNSFRIKYKLYINNLISLEGTNFLQNSLSDKVDYIIKSNTTLSVKLKKWLNFTSTLTYNKMNITHRENLLWSIGLNVERYF